MSTPAGWFDDPVQSGRLRYWDGTTWTEWISVNGQTVSSPIGAPMPPASGSPTGSGPIPDALRKEAYPGGEVQPTPGIQPAPGAGAAQGGWSGDFGAAGPDYGGYGGQAGPAGRDTYPMAALGRIGFILTAIAGLFAVAAFILDEPISRGTGFAGVVVGYDVDPSILALGIALAVVSILAIIIRPIWARLAALAINTGVAGFLGLALIGSRTGDPFLAGTDVDVRTGWWLIFVAVVGGYVGTLLAVLGIVQSRRTGGVDGGVTRSGKPTAALVLSLVSIIVSPLAPSGAGLGFIAKRDVAASGGRVSGGKATAGIIIGLILFLAAAIGITVAALVVTP